ncbi:MAG: zinc-dependent metalloprotease [Actinomycetota bacterium]|nr:zinc-dependent metalloprotease [Actinomycetota bacterium]
MAEKVACRVAERAPFGGAHHLDGLTAEFDEHTAHAEELVAATTGLRSLSGDARARVVTRPDWIRANLASLQRLLRPLFERIADDPERDASATTARIGALELGAVLGWMSTRVLGQYDLLVLEDEAAEDQDLVYYVGPNLVALERRYAFPRHDFRLWLALHEVTHRAQFMGVPWMRSHYLGLVTSLLGGAEPEAFDLVSSLKGALAKRRSGAPVDGADAAAGSGVLGAISTPEQQESLDRIAGLMSLLEGHGDVTMGRAGEGIVHGADRMARVMADRRRNASGVTRLFQKLVGLEAKLAQYAQGEAFIAAVEGHGGTALLDLVWEDPSHLPHLGEIREPDRWIARMAA